MNIEITRRARNCFVVSLDGEYEGSFRLAEVKEPGGVIAIYDDSLSAAVGDPFADPGQSEAGKAIIEKVNGFLEDNWPSRWATAQ